MQYFGFVYIWFDTKHKKYLIGSHHGLINDGYTTNTGGSRVRNIFKKRPSTMKRRILEYNTEKDDWRYTHSLEQKWLNLRPNIRTNSRYYNLKPYAQGGIDVSVPRTKPESWRRWKSEDNKRRVQSGTHNFTSDNTRKLARKRVASGSHHFLRSDHNKKPFILYKNGEFFGKFESKVDAVNKGIPAGLIDKLRKHSEYKLHKNCRVFTSFKAGDIIKYGEICS